MKNKIFMKYRIWLFIFIVIGLLGILTVYYINIEKTIPEVIYIQAQQEICMDYDIPVSGDIYSEVVETGTFSSTNEQCIKVDFDKPVVFHASAPKTYYMNLKLFKVLPYKEVVIEVIDERCVVPMGTPIGIYVKMDGVLVIDTGAFQNIYGVECAPSQGNLLPGDYITAVNGSPIQKKKELIQMIKDSQGEAMELTFQRGDVTMDRIIFPQQDARGEYKAGVWVRDSVQGIGTLTFIDENGQFAALGHGINDGDINELVKMNYGNIYTTKVVAIQKGQSGEPGGITGIIEYTRSNILGDIVANTQSGIKGYYNDGYVYSKADAMPIGMKPEVRTGYAQILCAVDGQQDFYDVEITEINCDSDNKKREIALKVTDEELLSLTGGIVQGMSGSPIIQDGKLIGAVTHVMVRDPKRGYGIFVENMLNVR